MFNKIRKILNTNKQSEAGQSQESVQPVVAQQPVVVNEMPKVEKQQKATDNRIEKMILDKQILRYVIINAYYAYTKDGEISLSKYSPLYYKGENSGIYLVISRDEACISDVHYVQETFADYGIKSEILSYNSKKGVFISGATISKLDEKLQEFLFDIAPVVLRNGERPYALRARNKEINDRLWAKSEFRKIINGGVDYGR